MMPVMGGEEFINELRKNNDMDNIPVILLTAQADDNLRIKLLTHGAQDYMIKPFSIEELSARMKNLVNIKIAKEQLQNELHSKTENINMLIEEITGRKKEIEISLTEKETMLKEIHHRVKNNLQIITSLLSLQTNKMHDSECIDILNESKNRIKAMSLIHEKLYHSEFLSRVNFGMYLQDLVDSISQFVRCRYQQN
jgi:two-component sensor histidine kinase